MLVTNSRLKETLLKVYSAPLQGTDLTSAHYCHTKKTYYLCSGWSKGDDTLIDRYYSECDTDVGAKASVNFIDDVCSILNRTDAPGLSDGVNK